MGPCREKDGKELAVSAAKLEVEQKLATQMLQRYQQGLAAGAALASGRGIRGGAFSDTGSPAFPPGFPGFGEEP